MSQCAVMQFNNMLYETLLITTVEYGLRDHMETSWIIYSDSNYDHVLIRCVWKITVGWQATSDIVVI